MFLVLVGEEADTNRPPTIPCVSEEIEGAYLLLVWSEIVPPYAACVSEE